MTLLDAIELPGNIQYVAGKKDDREIFVFTISTCQWCKKGKKWLEDNKFAYKYIDIDLLKLEEKRSLKKALKETFKPKYLAFPFIVIEGETTYTGFDDKEWKKLLS